MFTQGVRDVETQGIVILEVVQGQVHPAWQGLDHQCQSHLECRTLSPRPLCSS